MTLFILFNVILSQLLTTLTLSIENYDDDNNDDVAYTYFATLINSKHTFYLNQPNNEQTNERVYKHKL